jgi:hypothetical protein
MGSLSDYAEELGLRLIAHPVLQPLIVVGKIKNVGRTKLFANSTLHHKVAERRGYSSSSAVILHTNTLFPFFSSVPFSMNMFSE